MIAIDKLIRSRRKTIALIITRSGQLVVRAPLRASRAQIDQLVAEKSAWIRSHQAAMRARPPAAEQPITEGSAFLYLGQAYPLHFIPGRLSTLALKDGQFQICLLPAERLQQAFTAWFRRQARTILEERIHLHAARLGVHPGALRISSARSRWGSCSNRGTLSFPWRLVMAPLAVIDYVVVHELTHLTVKNHSRDFWQRVAAADPGYAAARKWLTANSDLGFEFIKTGE